MRIILFTLSSPWVFDASDNKKKITLVFSTFHVIKEIIVSKQYAKGVSKSPSPLRNTFGESEKDYCRLSNRQCYNLHCWIPFRQLTKLKIKKQLFNSR